MEINLKDVKVMISMPCGANVSWQTVQSIVETCIGLQKEQIEFSFQMVAGCSIVQHARTQVCNAFLKSALNTLFMISVTSDDYIPRPDDEFDDFQDNFITKILAGAVGWAIAPLPAENR